MGKSTSPFFSNRFKDSEFHITFNILHIIFIAILEHLQNLSGQNFITSLVDISFLSVFLTIFHNCSFYPIISFCAFVYEIIETLSWSYIKSGINFQVLSALEFIYALNVMPENVMRIFYWSIIIFGLTNVDFIRFNFRYTFYEFCMFVMLLMILFYPFSVDKYSNLYPFRINGLMSKKVFDKIVLSFTSKKQSKFESLTHKNLIMIEIESFETKCLGRFNKNYPKSMPFLSNLSDNILHFSKIPSQPYTTWSAAGMFVVHCGFPLIVNNVDWSVRGSENFELWKKLPCISDYLESLGYNQKAFCTGSCDIMNMKGFIKDHHYQTFDMAEHGIDRDSVLFNHIENDILPDLVKASKDEKKPFSLFILTADTHPEFWVDDKFCSDLTDENYKNEKGQNDGSNSNREQNAPNNAEGDDVMELKKKKIEDESEVHSDELKKKKGESKNKKKSSDDENSESKKKSSDDEESKDDKPKKKRKKVIESDVSDDSHIKKSRGSENLNSALLFESDNSMKKKKNEDGEDESKNEKKINETENSDKKKKKKSDKNKNDDESENSDKKKKKKNNKKSDSGKNKNDEDEYENSDGKKKKKGDSDQKETENSEKKKNNTDSDSGKNKNEDDDESEDSDKKKKKKNNKKSDSGKNKNDESENSEKKKNNTDSDSGKNKNEEDDESENSDKKKKNNKKSDSDKNKNDESENSDKKKNNTDSDSGKNKNEEDDESENSDKKKKKKNGVTETENGDSDSVNKDISDINDDSSSSINKGNEDDNGNRFNDDSSMNMNNDRSSDPMPKLFRCFTCFDRIFKKFYEKVQSIGLNASNTVFAVYGDHLTMGERSYYYGEDRTLSLIFPLITKQYIEQQYRTTKREIEKKRITYYDVAPTILDMLNIQFSPPFPFGNSAFSEEQNDPPGVDDFKFIYNYLTGDIEYTNVKCLNSDGFCTGNEY